MNRAEVKQVLQGLTEEIGDITDKKVATILNTLVNLVELLLEENTALRKENQGLKNEVNRLKGEQGKPDIRKQTKTDNNADHSSEDDRKKRRGKISRKPKMKKKDTVKIDRQETCKVDKDSLPKDSAFKGYETRVIQDLNIITDNVEFRLETYYSRALKKTFIAKLPAGYHGEFGPGIRALVIVLYRDSGMTESAIERLLKAVGIYISASTISQMITEGHGCFHQEKDDIIKAGLEANLFQNIDDTGCRVKGKNAVTHILCNPLFTAFFTRPHKDRLTILEILCCGELKFEINDNAFDLMFQLGLPKKRLAQLKVLSQEGLLTSDVMDELLRNLFPDPKKHLTNRRIIREAAAINYYRSSAYAIKFLMCDDAPQFNLIATYHALCWIHEGRHYKKLNPVSDKFRQILDVFIERFWDFYDELLTYKLAPTAAEAQRLSDDFKELFSTKTGYNALDARIALSLAKKESLLLSLSFPFLPLHNNAAELGARAQARMRDINLHTMSENGTKTKDTFATIVLTARKLGVNIYDYIHDRISEKFEMTSLADIIKEKSGILPAVS
jgi:hypothetical protein